MIIGLIILGLFILGVIWYMFQLFDHNLDFNCFLKYLERREKDDA